MVAPRLVSAMEFPPYALSSRMVASPRARGRPVTPRGPRTVVSVRFRVWVSNRGVRASVAGLAETSDGAPRVLAPGSGSVTMTFSPKRRDRWLLRPIVARLETGLPSVTLTTVQIRVVNLSTGSFSCSAFGYVCFPVASVPRHAVVAAGLTFGPGFAAVAAQG